MKTAFITGATEGIGLEFAKLFAVNNTNLVIVARNETRLKEVAKELSSFGIQVKIYAKDISVIENAEFIFNDLTSNNVQIDYVINNAGIGFHDSYTDTSWENELKLFNINMITVGYFTKVFASEMKSRRQGAILNVSSTATYLPIPKMAGYSASKAFVSTLSEIINYELKGTGVSVTTLCPGVTKTKFHETANSAILVGSKLLPLSNPEDIAKYGYKLIMKKKSIGIPGFYNKIMVGISKVLSRTFLLRISTIVLRVQHKS